MIGRRIARTRSHALEAGLDARLERDAERDERAEDAVPFGGILVRAIRSQQLWLTVGYFAALLLLARAYA